MEFTEFTEEFETHITVRLPNSDDWSRLHQWSIDHGLKSLHILLDRGLTASQPMLTRRGRGSFANQLAIATALCQSLNGAGFPAVRLKMEVSAANLSAANYSVPKSTAEAQQHHPDQYFEHHIKLLLDPSTELTALIELAEQQSAHLSRNILQTRPDHYHERFVTQRCIGVGYSEAQQQLQKLLAAIAALGYIVITVEQEFVVYDSNLDLDKGWIN